MFVWQRALLLAAILVAGCAKSAPPTITPVPAVVPASNSVDIPINPGPGGGIAPMPGPVTIGALTPYSDPQGRFSMDVPDGWVGEPQSVNQGDVILGMLFTPQVGTGLTTITLFDNGSRPAALGSTANQVLALSGVTNLPNYQELARSNVIEREGEAMRMEIAYQRTDGEQMHSLVLFQIDGTTFSMVNAGVAQGSWDANSPIIHDMLESFRVPATP